ncbi:uncharacterized protein EDB91DRAFT_112922 [Suillus paluster]|uniref:uncharacterized protein n=1 Tax=Suillus paluster TaxID=48578 RepID=UPI001B866560|nr:uncharacterized protein EDB91DRAFT_112922 [Suillus paluster]KAG1746741.1 hypothetical protein EDB91DRAFT_112922 [Suillus paluster]
MVTTRSASRVVGHDSLQVMVSNPGRFVPQASDEDSEGSDPGLAPHRVRKKSRKGAKSKSSKKLKRRGRLDLMPTMNLDILFHVRFKHTTSSRKTHELAQILSFLHPMDLLNLSRTSKDFRNLLLRRSSASAWKIARLQIEDLPGCPPDMSEPQYANLVFYPHCHDCDKVVRNVLWPLRVRYCPRCIDENTVNRWSPHGRIPSFDFDLPNVITYGPGRQSRQLLLKKAHDELLVEHPKTPADEMAAFLTKKRKHAAEVMEHARQCERWSKSVASSRKHELGDLRRNRQNAIIARLTEAGYKPELDYIDIDWLRDQARTWFREPKPLTQKSWDRMCPVLITTLDPVRARRLEDKVYGNRRRILMDEYKKYLQQPPPPGAAFDVMPHAVDVAEFGPFKDLITSPESTTIAATSFLSAFQQLPDLVSSWRAKIDHDFLDLVRFPENHGDSGKQKGSDWLQLATAVFVMESGNDCRLMMYPDVLLWPGFFSLSSIPQNDELFLLRAKQFGCSRWSTAHFSRINVFWGTAAVVQAANLDPKTTRREDMDRLDARFACGKCSTPGRKVVMTWEMAVMHSYRLHRDQQLEEIKWSLIEGDELANVKNYEREVKPPVKADAIVHCALCQHHLRDALSLTPILNHLAQIHGIPLNKAEQGAHYIPERNSISVISMVLDSDGKISNYASHRLVPSYSSGVELLYGKSHLV